MSKILAPKHWSRTSYIAFSLLFIAIMCFTLLPSPVKIGPLSFGGAGVAQATLVTVTFYPEPAGDVVIAGDTNAEASADWSNYVDYEKFAVAASLTIGKFYINCTAGGNVKLAVYDDDGAGGVPGTLLGSVDTTAVAANWNAITVSPGIDVTAGYIWLAFGADATATVKYTCVLSGKAIRYSTFANLGYVYGNYTFPATWGATGYSSSTVCMASVYVTTGNPVAGSDGQVYEATANESWATKHDNIAGTGASPEIANMYADIKSATTPNTDKWTYLYRSFIQFGTSSLPDGAYIVSATLSLYGGLKGDPAPWGIKANIYAATPASATTLVTGDFDQCALATPVAFSTEITYADWSAVAYNDYALNAAGKANINTTGTTSFSWRESVYDAISASGTAPAWASNKEAYMGAKTSEAGAEYKPKLVIVYNLGMVINTLAADDLTATSATLNGNITTIYSGGNITNYGFVLSTSPQSDPGDVSPSAQATYTAGNWTWTGANLGEGDTFDSNGNVTGLTSGTVYYFRAAGYNTDGWCYGYEQSFVPPPPWLTGYYTVDGKRTLLTITENGGGAKDDYSIEVEGYYNSPPFQKDGIFTASPQNPNPPAFRYHGTYDRTYIGYYTSQNQVEIKYWDDDTLVLSDPVVLWSSWGNSPDDVLGDDHAGAAVLVLQHQVSGNGKILVATAEHNSRTANKGRLQTRRSTNVEDISAFDAAVSVETIGTCYPSLIELDDGTVWLWYRYYDGTNMGRPYWRVSTDGGASWSASTAFAYFGSGKVVTYSRIVNYGNEVHVMLMYAGTDVTTAPLTLADFKNSYYVYTSDATASPIVWKKRDGTTVTIPCTEATADLVHTTTAPVQIIGSSSTATDNDVANQVYWTRYQCTQSGYISNLKVYSGDTGNIKFAIYSDKAGPYPDALLFAGIEAKAVSAGQWNTVSFSSLADYARAYSLTSGTYYWIGIVGDTAGTFVYDALDTGTGVYVGATYSTYSFPATVPAAYTATTRDKCVQGLAATFEWEVDIQVDGVGNPYLLSVETAVLGGNSRVGNLLLHTYSAGWSTETVSTSLGFFATYSVALGTASYPAMAALDHTDMDTIYAGIYVTNACQIQKLQKVEGSWTKTEDITQSSPGDNMRPMYVKNANPSGKFKLLWCYTERYISWNPTYWSSMLFAYPGFNNQNFIDFSKNCRTDFGDVRFTLSDGTTLQPAASSGRPWIENKTDSWMARFQLLVGDIPASAGGIRLYAYYGNSTNTNTNDQDTMKANLPLFATHFDEYDTALWDTVSGSPSVASSELTLSNARIRTDSALANIGTEVRTSAKMTTVGDGTLFIEIVDPADGWNDARVVGVDAATIRRQYTKTPNKDDYDNLTWFTTSGYRTYSISRYATNLTVLRQVDNWAYSNYVKGIENYTDTVYIQTADSKLNLVSAASNVAVWDWVFIRPVTNPEPKISMSASGEEAPVLPDISNTPSSWSVGIVQPSQTIYSKTGLTPPGFPLAAGNCTGNVTNNFSFTLDYLTVVITDFSGGTAINIVSTAPGTNEVRVMIFESGAGNDTDGIYLTNAAQNWVADVAASEEVYWELKLETGSRNTFGYGVYTATLTFTTDPAGDSETVTITFTWGDRRRGIGIAPAFFY